MKVLWLQRGGFCYGNQVTLTLPSLCFCGYLGSPDSWPSTQTFGSLNHLVCQHLCLPVSITPLLLTSICMHPQLCVLAWTADFILGLNHWLDGPGSWWLLTPDPHPGRLLPFSDTWLSQAGYIALCLWLMISCLPDNTMQTGFYETALDWPKRGCLLSWMLKRRNIDDNYENCIHFLLFAVF